SELVDADRDVALEGEARVLEAALEDFLVPGSHDVGIAGVRNEGEAVGAKREVTLMRLHCCRHHTLWKPEEPLAEASLLHPRRLGEVHDLVDDVAGIAPRTEIVEAARDGRHSHGT